jgi:hypothetical protein
MAEILLHKLAQRGVSVVRDLAAVVAGNGYPQAIAETPTGGLSFARHLSPSDPMLDPNPPMRDERANPGAGSPAKRVGRPGSSAGVLRQSGPARTAGRTILFGRSLTSGTTATRTALVTPTGVNDRCVRPRSACWSPTRLSAKHRAAERWHRRHQRELATGKRQPAQAALAIG